MSGFEAAVRALARSGGHKINDTTPVTVEMTDQWSGYSEDTITNAWEAFTITCGTYSETFENEGESRGQYPTPGPECALAKLWDALSAVADE